MLRTRGFLSLSGNLQLIVTAEQTSTAAEDAHHVKTALRPMCLRPYLLESFPKGLTLQREKALVRRAFGWITSMHVVAKKLLTQLAHMPLSTSYQQARTMY